MFVEQEVKLEVKVKLLLQKEHPRPHRHSVPRGSPSRNSDHRHGFPPRHFA
jgi:hypothetical protein